jgi:predicted Ser/Thr protein kinase
MGGDVVSQQRDEREFVTLPGPLGRGSASSALPPLEEFAAGLALLSADERAPQMWADQRLRWQNGERPTVEMYANKLPAPVGGDVLLDLIYGEFVLRQEAGESPTVLEYQSRFPDLAAQIGRQLSLHLAISESADASDRSMRADPWTTVTEPARASTASRKDTAGGPTEIAGYKIVAPLEAGGQGSVYRAVHPTLGRDVVLKLGHAPVGAGQQVDALIQEGRILAELDDPGLARIYDLFLHEGCVCLVMEYVRGRNLEQDARDRARDPRAAAALLARVARAVALAHQRGVIHRDIKPGNILIDEAGNPRLIDFGLARLEDAWRRPSSEIGLSGTVSYMAPEQARGETPSPLSDVFALGGVLYFLLTGRAPFRGAGFTEVLNKAQRGEWDRAPLADAKIPPRLRLIVEKALATEPAARHASAEELARALEDFLRPDRTRWLVAGGAILTAAAAVIGIWIALRPAPEPDRGPAPSPPAKIAPDVKPRPFALQVRVWRASRYVDLVDCVPVGAEDEIRIESVAPAGMHAALFVRASSGKIALLASFPPAEEDRPLRFPENPKKASKLTPPAGNELILLCARRSGPIGAEDLRELLAGCTAWPTLPADAVSGLSPAGFKALQKSRDLGSLTDRADPEGEVQKGLEELQRRLRPHFEHFEAIVFSHGE